MTGRVAIIGAGPCGLGALRAYQTAADAGVDVPEVVCYEKQDDWGGLWNYTWRTGTDEHGEPVHGSMYRYLWSNGPKECLEFADYSFVEHFGQPIPSFPPRAVLADYILGRAKEAGVRKHIRFSTPVKQVSWDDSSQQFAVTARNHAEDRLETEMYDWVIVANGHFSVPNIPTFDGIESFSGRVMHGHDFRDAREFAGKNVLIVGGSYSAEDISLQCHKYGASSVTISYRSGAMGFSWPDTMKEVPLISSIDNSTIHFSDGTSGEFDAIVMCTGYLHSFPFLADELRLVTGNRLYCRTSTTRSRCSTSRRGSPVTSLWAEWTSATRRRWQQTSTRGIPVSRVSKTRTRRSTSRRTTAGIWLRSSTTRTSTSISRSSCSSIGNTTRSTTS